MGRSSETTGNGWETHPCHIGKARGMPSHEMRCNKAGKGRYVCETCGIDATRDGWLKLETEATPPARTRAPQPRERGGEVRKTGTAETEPAPTPPPDPLAALRALPKEPPPEAVEAALRGFAAGVVGKDRLAREAAREAALQALTGKLSAPARMVDAALGRGEGATGGPELQGKAAALEPPEPWPEPVDGAALLSEIRSTFERFLVLPDGAAAALSLWVVFTHAHDAAAVSPLLALVSPEMRCGKSTAIDLLGALVPKSLPFSNTSTAALFRSVEKFSPTVLVDEADSFLGGREELRGILNSGHTRAGAFVLRVVGEDFEPRRFSTWAPKAVAMIGRLPGTLEDRAVLVPMRRKARGETVERLRLDRLGAETEALRSKAARWAADHLEALRDADPETPGELHDRAADNWRPLLAIADLAGGPWPAEARAAARVLSAGAAGEDSSVRVALLSDLREIFEQTGRDRIFTDELLQALHRREDRPWGEWGRSRKPISPHALSRQLAPFGVKPRQIRDGDENRKGYRLADLEDPFRRYLPPSEAKHPKQANNGGGLRDSPKRNTGEDVSVQESPQTPMFPGVVSDVSVRSPGDGWEDV